MRNLNIYLFSIVATLIYNNCALFAQETAWDNFRNSGSLTAPATSEVTIGKQVWMTSNLNVDKFRNGEPILEARTIGEWIEAGNNKIPAFCHYDTIVDYGSYYGKLYNWYAVDDSKDLCPDGWHVPSQEEWNYLDSVLGGNFQTGLNMKHRISNIVKVNYVEKGGFDEMKTENCPNCHYWTAKQKELYPCSTCKNRGYLSEKTGRYIPRTREKVIEKMFISWSGYGTSGFHPIPAGFVFDSFQGLGKKAFWWSSTEINEKNSVVRGLNFDSNLLIKGGDTKAYGLSVRCIKN